MRAESSVIQHLRVACHADGPGYFSIYLFEQHSEAYTLYDYADNNFGTPDAATATSITTAHSPAQQSPKAGETGGYEKPLDTVFMHDVMLDRKPFECCVLVAMIALRQVAL